MFAQSVLAAASLFTFLSAQASSIRIPRPTPFIRNLPPSTPTPAPVITPSPTPSPAAPTSTDSIKAHLMTAINDYRRSQGLSEVTTDPYTCALAKDRAAEISKKFNHDGFNSRIQSKTLPYPSYSSITENISMNSQYQNVVPGWIKSSGHAHNMRQDTPFVCVEKYSNYYAYEGWKP